MMFNVGDKVKYKGHCGSYVCCNGGQGTIIELDTQTATIQKSRDINIDEIEIKLLENDNE